jgi:hypothetical protein
MADCLAEISHLGTLGAHCGPAVTMTEVKVRARRLPEGLNIWVPMAVHAISS